MSEQADSIELTPETLGQVDAFRDLPLTERTQIIKLCDYRFYLPGQSVIAYDDDSKDVFFIVSGQVQVINYGASGQQVTLQDVAAGKMFGELSAIDGGKRSAHVVTVSESKIFSITPDDFMLIMKNYPSIAEATLVRLVDMVRNLGRKVYYRDALPANQRVQAELLRLALQQGKSKKRAIIKPAPSHTDIAYHIGTSRETVTREMASLRREGIISRSNDGLIICDIPLLTKMIGKALASEGGS